jgi:flagellar hook-associated protein 1 FlgK
MRTNTQNTGSGVPSASIDAATVAELSSSDYRLRYVGGNFELTRLADNQVQTYLSLPQTVDGITIDLGTWLPDPNDSVLIQPTRSGAQSLAVALTDARQIAAAAPIRSSAAVANTGTARISAGTVDVQSPINPDLRNRVTITFTSTTTADVFDVTSGLMTAGVPYTAGADIAYNGWTTQITGNPAVGDVFTIEANANGVADSRNVALLGALQTRNTMNAGSGSTPTASYQSAYAQIVSAVGSKANEVAAMGASQQGLADHASLALQSLSGVNLDEEAANLLRYQQAYQAAAKVLEIAGRVFDEVLALGR